MQVSVTHDFQQYLDKLEALTHAEIVLVPKQDRKS